MLLLTLFSVCFFFQAEDGIRALVRSRGLGDVYKRQDVPTAGRAAVVARGTRRRHRRRAGTAAGLVAFAPVSYTHLTLPTIYSV